MTTAAIFKTRKLTYLRHGLGA